VERALSSTEQSQVAEPPPPMTLDIRRIQQILPHRYPFLLIDRVIEIERKRRIVALKNVTVNEPFFQGHFPGFPVMPGVLTIEAMAQAGGALLLTEVEDRDGKVMFFTGIERARFRRPIVPGDQLRIEVKVLAWRRNAVRMEGFAYVDGKLAAEAVITCRLADLARSAPEGEGDAREQE
jgi:3-hydroxyacyl-[acyl-carrier-protein] dehydratase